MPMSIDKPASRRHFLQTVAASLPALSLAAQTPNQDLWGGPVVDCHHHLRRAPEANIVHLDGCGVSNANGILAKAG